jgi:AraC family transcriptional regulator, transcriptional activator of pobA
MQRDALKINYVELPQPNKLLVIEPLDYPNPYDYKKLHRHDYFELILVNEGQGSQLIDFTSYDIGQGGLYVIYPGQVHLMNRNTAKGLVIQFRKDIFEYIHPVKHYNLYVNAADIQCSNNDFNHLYDIAERINKLVSSNNVLSPVTKHKAYSYLQIILLSLVELSTSKQFRDNEHHIIEEYLSLITSHIQSRKKVSEYSTLLGCSPDKLNELCKAALGKTALELIHEELILEIRRLLLLNEMSLKEIAFELNFDSQANFSGFIKTKTGLTPTELQTSVLEIYN